MKMRQIPYGYKIENGQAVIDETPANNVRMLFKHYLSGLSLENAAKEAGINTYHSTAKNMLTNKHYLGDDFYPAIISLSDFEAARELRIFKAIRSGRFDITPKTKELKIPTKFTTRGIIRHFDDPIEQAEYLYSLIESEE